MTPEAVRAHLGQFSVSPETIEAAVAAVEAFKAHVAQPTQGAITPTEIEAIIQLILSIVSVFTKPTPAPAPVPTPAPAA